MNTVFDDVNQLIALASAVQTVTSNCKKNTLKLKRKKKVWEKRRKHVTTHFPSA